MSKPCFEGMDLNMQKYNFFFNYKESILSSIFYFW